MSFSPEQLLSVLHGWPTPASYWIAYSGGLDSSVLLHAMSGLRDGLTAPVHAAHVHHGLQPEADAWREHCTDVCRSLGVPCATLQVQVTRTDGDGVEAAARRARYTALNRLLPEGAMLLTAHHRDDQAETLLLQLLRGAGPAGLAGIGELNPRGNGWIGRPLLTFDRAELRAWAEVQKLQWIEDPSNEHVGADRNYLRHRILPRLRTRWPGLTATLSRSARHCGAAQRVMVEVAENLFRADPRHRAYRLAIGPLLALSADQQALLLRHWLGVSGLPLPDTQRLHRLVSEVAQARPDAAPCVRWPGAEVRRYRGQLVAMPPLAEPVSLRELVWGAATSLDLPGQLGRLRLGEQGLALPRAAWRAGPVRVRFGGQGLAATPAGRAGRRSFKRLCQDWDVPPWLRARVPLVFIDGRLAAVADYGSCEPYAVRPGEPIVRLQWQRPEYLV